VTFTFLHAIDTSLMRVYLSTMFMVWFFLVFQTEGMSLHLFVAEFTSQPSALLASDWASP
jgi:hypothetical protein